VAPNPHFTNPQRVVSFQIHFAADRVAVSRKISNVRLRNLAIQLARHLPLRVKRWVHGSRVLDRLARRSFTTLVGDGETAAIVAGPMRGILLVTSEHVSHAHLSGTYELDVLQAVEQLVRDGDVCYDLGASIGYLSLLMARRARAVFAFEPAPHAAAEIRRHADANGFAHITIVPQPVSDSPRLVQFALTDAAYGSSISDGTTDWPSLELLTTTLDAFVADHPFPDFVKIDVEGFEGHVLEGARTVLARGITTWCIELHSTGASRHVVSLLTEYGYEVTALDGAPFSLSDSVIAGELQVIASAPRRVSSADPGMQERS